MYRSPLRKEESVQTNCSHRDNDRTGSSERQAASSLSPPTAPLRIHCQLSALGVPSTAHDSRTTFEV